jgi:cleavage and polyadenylation specificity factor subunit 4
MGEECPYYERGFCKIGYSIAQLAVGNGVCNFTHVNDKVCANYLVGFCPEGPECKLAHAYPTKRLL